MALLLTQDSSYGTWNKTGLERGLSKPLEGTYNGELIDLSGRTAVLFQDIINTVEMHCIVVLYTIVQCSAFHFLLIVYSKLNLQNT